MQTLRNIHCEVWAFRHRNERYWPTPITLDSLRFALTEVAKAIDADLRSIKEYRRNNIREQDITEELADCAIMLATALGPDYDTFISYNSSNASLEGIAKHIAIALYDVSRWRELVEPTGYDQGCIIALNMIATHVGHDVICDEVASRLDRIFEKHVLGAQGGNWK